MNVTIKDFTVTTEAGSSASVHFLFRALNDVELSFQYLKFDNDKFHASWHVVFPYKFDLDIDFPQVQKESIIGAPEFPTLEISDFWEATANLAPWQSLLKATELDFHFKDIYADVISALAKTPEWVEYILAPRLPNEWEELVAKYSENEIYV